MVSVILTIALISVVGGLTNNGTERVFFMEVFALSEGFHLQWFLLFYSIY